MLRNLLIAFALISMLGLLAGSACMPGVLVGWLPRRGSGGDAGRSARRLVGGSGRRLVCGEEAGDADFACLLAGLGVRELSMTPVRAGAVRHALRKLDCPAMQDLANQALRCTTPKQVRSVS